MANLSSNEKQFLKNLIQPVNRLLLSAWGLSFVSTLLFVVQSWLLASIFSYWLDYSFQSHSSNSSLSKTSDSVNEHTLYYWLIFLILCFLIRPLLSLGRELISQHASLKVRRQLRQRLLHSMAILGPNLRHFGNDGSISSQIIDQTDALDGYISRFSVQKMVATSTPLILLIAVAWQSKLAAILLLLTAPLVPIFMILIGHLTARKSAQQFTALAQLSGRFLDWVRGLPTLKRLQAVPIAYDDLSNSSEDYRRRTMDVLKIAFLNGAVLELLAALSIALVAVYLGFGLMGILPWDKGHVPVPYFGALFVLLLAPEFYLPLRQLGADYHAKAQAEGAVQSLLPIIEAATAQSLSNSKTVAESPPPSFNNQNLRTAFGLDFDNVSIQTPIITPSSITPSSQSQPDYQSQPQNQHALGRADDETVEGNINHHIINDEIRYRTRLAPVSFRINPGERIALIGHSGSGKSSLIQAIMGFVEYQGEIKLLGPSYYSSTNDTTASDSLSHREMDISSLRQHIGYLAQQVALMPITIAENLRLADPDATDNQLIEVLETVELWSLIKRLPEGIHTKLGERGKGLSGGQQQRLAIAQLLLRHDSLWLLDEPTEHLDPDTAAHIHQLLEVLSRNKTVIWVTHATQHFEWLDKVIELSPPTTPIESQQGGRHG